MSDNDLVDAWLANQRLERLEGYIKRGRPLADISLEELRARWIAAMRAWASSLSEFDHEEREDIEAEMKLRKIEPPFDLVKDQLNAIRSAATKVGAENLDDLSAMTSSIATSPRKLNNSKRAPRALRTEGPARLCVSLNFYKEMR